MFNILPILVLLSTPCTQAQYVEEGSISACGGIVMPEQWAREYVECTEVSIPNYKLKLDNLQSKCSLTEEFLKLQISTREKKIEDLTYVINNPPPSNEESGFFENASVYISVASIFFLGGLILGYRL